MISLKHTSILLGAWVFKESHLGRNLAAGMIMVAGVELIIL